MVKKLLVSIIVIAFSSFLVLYTIHATKNAPQTSRVAIPGNSDVRLLETTVDDIDEGNVWSIKLSYPRVAGIADTSLQSAINTRIESFIEKNVSDFKNEAAKQPKDTAATPANNLVISYVANRVDRSFISLDFSVSQYYYHMSHPETVHTTITYSLPLKKELKITDLFKDGVNFVQPLSDFSIKDLTAQLGPDTSMTQFIKTGASAKLENFSKFNVSHDQLLLIFDPYLVAPYSAGTRHVNIPLETLKEILNPDLHLTN